MVPAAVSAQPGRFPTKAIRLILPFPPGGGIDIVGRAIADTLSARFGSQVVVDNRGGGSGIIAAELVARAPNDGYTLLLGNSGLLATQPNLRARLPYDPIKDYEPISLLVTSPYLLVVNPGLGISTVKELIALAKAKPNQINYGTPSLGSVSHLAAELFKAMAGVNLTHVPYKGTGPAITDLLGGQIPVMFAATASVMNFVATGRLRALAISTEKRNPALPQIPTVAEAALPGYQIASWNGLLAPRGTPQTVIARLNSEIHAVMRQGELRDRLAAQGFDAEVGSPQEFAAHIRTELARFRKLVTIANIKIE
jgi:tripartite-type tricarboxylate transporter receptor subunit TctC